MPPGPAVSWRRYTLPGSSESQWCPAEPACRRTGFGSVESWLLAQCQLQCWFADMAPWILCHGTFGRSRMLAVRCVETELLNCERLWNAAGSYPCAVIFWVGQSVASRLRLLALSALLQKQKQKQKNEFMTAQGACPKRASFQNRNRNRKMYS